MISKQLRRTDSCHEAPGPSDSSFLASAVGLCCESGPPELERVGLKLPLYRRFTKDMSDYMARSILTSLVGESRMHDAEIELTIEAAFVYGLDVFIFYRSGLEKLRIGRLTGSVKAEPMTIFWANLMRLVVVMVWHALNNPVWHALNNPVWHAVHNPALLSSLASECPGNTRPPCTTMPWTMYPALLVLWGVCWMFHGPYDHPRLGSHHPRHPPPPQPYPLAQIESPSSVLPSEFEPWLNDFTTFEYQDAVGQDTVSLGYGLTPPLNPEPAATGMMADFSALGYQPAETTSACRPVMSNPGEVPTTPSASLERSAAVSTASSAVGQALNSPASGDPNSMRLLCSMCQKTFKNNFTLRRHQNDKHGSGSERHLCPHEQCIRTGKRSSFEREDQLRRHLMKYCKHEPRDKAGAQASPRAQKRARSEIRERDGPSPQKSKTAATHNENAPLEVLRRDNQAQMEALEAEERNCHEAKVTLEAKERECKEARVVLEAKERECQGERARLENIAACIQQLEQKQSAKN